MIQTTETQQMIQIFNFPHFENQEGLLKEDQHDQKDKRLSQNSENINTQSQSINKYSLRKLNTKIYYYPKPNRKVTIQVLSNFDVDSAIDNAIKSITNQYMLTMDLNSKNYNLYPAKKNGLKDQDMPEIHRKQKLKWTGINSFTLEEKQRSQSCYIQVNLEKKYALNLKKNRKISKQIKCFCFSC